MASTRTKYSLDSSALIIYRGDSAYVRYADTALSETVARYGAVRILDEHEAREFEASLPFLAPAGDEEERRMLRLGDAISSLTKRLGIRECNSCQRRRSRLNRIVLWRW
jgi:hypothetical protein